MQACVHIVDDDASFRTAMERRLTKAGYEVATYPSALHLLVNLPTESCHTLRPAASGGRCRQAVEIGGRRSCNASWSRSSITFDRRAVVAAIRSAVAPYRCGRAADQIAQHR